MEFIGDSDTAARFNLVEFESGVDVRQMGEEELAPDCHKYTDIDLGWVTFVAAAFSAVPLVVACSGMGVAYQPYLVAPIESCYNAPLTCQSGECLVTAGPSEQLLQQSEAPEVCLVVLYAGGNDFLDIWRLGEQGFVAGYTRLLQKIRARRPLAPILCLVPVSDAATCCYSHDEQRWFTRVLRDCVSRATKAAGGVDQKIYLRTVHPMPSRIDTSSRSDFCLHHWTVQAHQKWAQGVIHVIESLNLLCRDQTTALVPAHSAAMINSSWMLAQRPIPPSSIASEHIPPAAIVEQQKDDKVEVEAKPESFLDMMMKSVPRASLEAVASPRLVPDPRLPSAMMGKEEDVTSSDCRSAISEDLQLQPPPDDKVGTAADTSMLDPAPVAAEMHDGGAKQSCSDSLSKTGELPRADAQPNSATRLTIAVLCGDRESLVHVIHPCLFAHLHHHNSMCKPFSLPGWSL